MELLLRPGIRLMLRCRLYQKFALVSICFLLPAGLITGLLVHELHRSIDLVHQERIGAEILGRLQNFESLIQVHRGWQHLSLAGNQGAIKEMRQVSDLIDQNLPFLERPFESTLNSRANEGLRELHTAIEALVKESIPLSAVDAFRRDTAILEQLHQLRSIVADSTQLSLDPQVETTYLIHIYSKNLPELLSTIADTSARGAPYIDTGLMAANDDVIINANILLGQRDQQKLFDIMQTATQSDPKLVTLQDALKNQLKEQEKYTQRTKEEVLNTLNQSSSTSFLKAGIESLNQWQKWGDQIRTHLDSRLQDRLRSLQWNRNLTLIIILCVLTLATYFLLSFYRAFSQQVHSISLSAKKIREGILNEPLQSDGNDELAALQTDFENMRLVLAKLVAEIRTGAQQISITSQEIALGNSELSSRTEQQAQSLSATTFSAKELTNTMQRNSLSALEANEQAWQTREIARKGGEMVAQLVVRMESIQGSSQRIHDIIGVIDSIAFQTNILALNAAVEAARAGEQGRGFAVVATEVRSLAQRSADAAKEIKVLIGSSVEQIRAGHAQVHTTGSTMQQLLNGIDEVTEKMKSISDASAAQTEDLQIVDTSLTQLDGITQQNTALVEEAAAAADNLHQQAKRLSDAVAFFTMESTHTTSTKAHPGNHRTLGNRAYTETLVLPRPTGEPGIGFDYQ